MEHQTRGMNRLAEVRRNRGLSQTELGDRIGKRLATISRYESGERGMSAKVIQEIAKVLNVEPHELFFSTTLQEPSKCTLTK